MALHWLLVAAHVYTTACAAHSSIPTNYSTAVIDHPDVSPRLLYGETHGVSWSDLGLDYRLPPLVSRVYLDVLGLDYHYRHRWLFYSGLGQIWRMTLDQDGGDGDPEVVVEDAGGATSVAVDWLEDRVYWLSPATRTVRRADLSGAGQEVVLTAANVSRTANLVLDPYSRFIFLPLGIKNGGVLRSGLEEAAEMRVTVQLEGEKLQEVVNLALDVRHSRLFLSAREDHLPTVLSCDYDGRAVRRHYISDTWWHQVPSLGILGERLFWVHHDWPGAGPGTDTVWKTGMNGADGLEWTMEYRARAKLLDPNNRIWALNVYHPDVQSPPMVQGEELEDEVTSSNNN